MTGLSIIKGCSPLSYTFTDLHSTVLKTLKENVLINLRDRGSSAEDCLEDASENLMVRIICDRYFVLFGSFLSHILRKAYIPNIFINLKGSSSAEDCLEDTSGYLKVRIFLIYILYFFLTFLFHI